MQWEGQMSRLLHDSGPRQRANKVSRRAFGQLLVGATAAATVPLFVPARLLGAAAPSNRLRVGQIGCGRIAQVHDVPSVLKSGLADYVAVCDLDSRRAADSKEQLAAFLPRSDEHHRNCPESVRSRREPIAPARIAHRSGSACIVSWIAMKLGRPVSWDIRAERFVNDPRADEMLARHERAPYGVQRQID
jgi:Oxidoreductase family, C-terminal alpha/beta domain